MARNSLLCADVPLRNYSLTHSLQSVTCTGTDNLTSLSTKRKHAKQKPERKKRTGPVDLATNTQHALENKPKNKQAVGGRPPRYAS